MGNILTKIIDQKQDRSTKIEGSRSDRTCTSGCKTFISRKLTISKSMAVIAEIKRASPSKGKSS